MDRPVTKPRRLPLRAVSLFGFIAAAMISSTALAGHPHVQFDVSYAIECRDVTTEEFSELNPNERLLEAKFQISSLITSGHEGELIQFLYRIESPHKSVEVIDYLPKTTLATRVVGSVGIQESRESSTTLGISASGKYDYFAQGNATAATSSKRASSVKYELLPPLELLAASGTTARAAGVYFKLKPSPRDSLEGAKDFAMVLRVPAGWRGDLIRVECEAIGHNRGMVRQLDEKVTSGKGTFYVALYAAGDEEAKQVAHQFLRSELELRDVVRAGAREIRRTSIPSQAHQLGVMFAVTSPKIPENWFSRVMETGNTAAAKPYYHRLPKSVRAALDEYEQSQGMLVGMNGR